MPDNEYAMNYQREGAFITGRTAHVVAERDDSTVVADCGFEFRAPDRRVHDRDEDPPREKYKCGNCDWGEE